MSIRTNIPLFSEQRDLLFHKLTPNLEATAAYDDKTVQRTVIYDRSPRVTLVDSLQSKVQVENYHDLPALPLTDEQMHLIETKIIPTLLRPGGFLEPISCSWMLKHGTETVFALTH